MPNITVTSLPMRWKSTPIMFHIPFAWSQSVLDEWVLAEWLARWSPLYVGKMCLWVLAVLGLKPHTITSRKSLMIGYYPPASARRHVFMYVHFIAFYFRPRFFQSTLQITARNLWYMQQFINMHGCPVLLILLHGLDSLPFLLTFINRECKMLTHWGRGKMAAVSHTTLSNAFSWIKIFRISIKISLKFVPKGPINYNPALVQIIARRRSGDKPLSEPMMVSLLTHKCVTRP